MTQDTRKDRRVKIVSLNVRYKSATVDEFIENHAHDVSRGGIYIKTGSPFPPGTLLKFEIRLSSDQAVITGVGRVVWKRDTTQGTGERPSGMGVKFIKIDDPSKTVIDRLVNSRSDAGRSYESESETPNPEPLAAAAAAPAPPSNRPVPNRIGKSTMLGMGAVAGATQARAPARPGGSVPPRPSVGGGMFPKASPEADEAPKQEQTVMKQAAELLEEALREAGGTMEDVGTNPLFAGSAPSPSDKVEVKASVPPGESPESLAAAERTRAMVAGMSAGEPRKAMSDPPRTSRESPVAKAPDRVEPKPVSQRPSGRVSIASAPPKPPKKKGAGGTLLILAVAAAAAVAGVVYRDSIFGADAPMPSPVPQAASASAAPSASEAPAASEALAAASASAAAAAVSASAGSASADASAMAAPSASGASALSASAPAGSVPAAASASAAPAPVRVRSRRDRSRPWPRPPRRPPPARPPRPRAETKLPAAARRRRQPPRRAPPRRPRSARPSGSPRSPPTTTRTERRARPKESRQDAKTPREGFFRRREPAPSLWAATSR